MIAHDMMGTEAVQYDVAIYCRTLNSMRKSAVFRDNELVEFLAKKLAVMARCGMLGYWRASD